MEVKAADLRLGYYQSTLVFRKKAFQKFPIIIHPILKLLVHSLPCNQANVTVPKNKSHALIYHFELSENLGQIKDNFCVTLLWPLTAQNDDVTFW